MKTTSAWRFAISRRKRRCMCWSFPSSRSRRWKHVADGDAALMGHLMLVARDLARQFQLDDGYRVVANCGPDGGQTVDHLHLHLLGGRQMKWPPG